jgi:peptidoglycan hydrolase CwlO-like protein
MNKALELKKKKAELLRVRAAKAEQEFKVEECRDQIERLQASMKIQDERADQLQKEIQDLEMSE